LDQGQGYVALDKAALQRQPLGLQRRLFRHAISLLRPGLRDIDFRTIEHAVHFLKDASDSGQIDLSAGLRLELEGERLWLATWEADLPGVGWPQLEPGMKLQLDAPGEIDLPGGWRLQAETLSVDAKSFELARSNSDPYQAWLDQTKLELPLTVRARQPGERFRPLGMGGHSMKLADFMINHGLPRRGRAGWPLVVSGEEIVWVPGYQMSESCSIKEDSRQVVHLSLRSLLVHTT
jgi:tRNA(Ile)-lysidine synthase